MWAWDTCKAVSEDLVASAWPMRRYNLDLYRVNFWVDVFQAALGVWFQLTSLADMSWCSRRGNSPFPCPVQHSHPKKPLSSSTEILPAHGTVCSMRVWWNSHAAWGPGLRYFPPILQTLLKPRLHIPGVHVRPVILVTLLILGEYILFLLFA